MPRRSWSVMLLVASCACGERTAPPIASDPIPDVPPNQQRAISRDDFRLNWPFTVGKGTVGCASGAVIFRTGGVTYALNDAAAARGFTPVDVIRATQHPPPPRELVSRVRQNEREAVFAKWFACSDGPNRDPDPAGCRQRLMATSKISDAELKLIEAEGVQRRWAPLPAARVPLDPVIAAGSELCPH